MNFIKCFNRKQVDFNKRVNSYVSKSTDYLLLYLKNREHYFEPRINSGPTPPLTADSRYAQRLK